MMRSNRGAARVSVVWVIATIVVALVAIAFAVISQQDLTTERTAARTATTASAEAEQRFTEESQYARTVSRQFGFYDRTAAAPRTNPEAARRGFDELRSVFTQIDPSINDFEQALPIVRREYESRGQTIAELNSRVRQLESELATERQGRQADVRAKDTTIANLRSQLADEQRNASDREAELQSRLTSAMAQVSGLDQDVRRLSQEMTQAQRGHAQEAARLGARLDEAGRKLNFMSPERRDEPDARILAVSAMLGSAWIDIGQEHRVARGMRFRVESAGDRNRRVKGYAEVV
jgi:chromosome segregation ATPase